MAGTRQSLPQPSWTCAVYDDVLDPPLVAVELQAGAVMMISGAGMLGPRMTPPFSGTKASSRRRCRVELDLVCVLMYFLVFWASANE